MPTEDDTTYFRRRALIERSKAEQATDPICYRLHLELARQYEIRLRHISPRPVRTGAPV